MCPLYEYRCSDCQTVFEEFWLDLAEVEENEPAYLLDAECPHCKSKNKTKIMSNQMVQMKGEGWTNKTILPEGNGKKDSTESLRDKAREIKENAKNMTTRELYGDLGI